MDLSNWMGNLPDVLHNVPLTDLAIPGSHDSFSYSIKADSEIGPEDRRLQCFDTCMCFSKATKRVVFRWSKTQLLTCTQQLMSGIRYFDFRLAAKLGTLTPFIIHGMYGANAIELLKEIHSFLLPRPREIVLLDFQHFYNFSEETHVHTIASVKWIFGSLLHPFQTTSPDLRLKTLWANRYQVFVFYRNGVAEEMSRFVWPKIWITNPWPNTYNPTEMIRILDINYNKGRDGKSFFVTQGILTPDFTYIFFRMFSNLQRSLATKSNKVLTKWLRDKTAGRNGINIVIADFVEMQPFNFITTVINLNYKLARDIIERN